MTGRRLRIFIAHPSEVLTDHLPHGDGLVSYSYIQRLAGRGHELHVAAQRVALRDPLPPTLHVHPLSPDGGTSAMNRLVFMARMRELFERLRSQAPFDVIHQMNPVFTGLSLALAGVRTPLVLGSFVPRWQSDSTVAARPPSLKTRVAEAAERLVAQRQQARAAALLIASPEALARICRPARHEGRIFEIPHGIDLSRFPPRTRVPARPSVLFLTSVQYRKGIFTLLDAFARVSRAVPGVELVIAGVGPDLAEVQRRAAAMPDCTITFTGKVEREHVGDVMRWHSVYCLPSIGEPFGMTVLEAMACGVPVVGTRAGGIPDLLSAQGGRLVPPRDPVALATALIEVLRSPDLQRTMGRHNRARVEEVFDIEKTVDRLEAVYGSILTPTPATSSARSSRAQEEAC